MGMAKWLSSVFYEIKSFEKMPVGEYYWFEDIEDWPDFKDNVFPFTLHRDHPNFRTPKESIKIGAVQGYVLDDLGLLLKNTVIAVDKLNDDKSLAIVLEVAPSFIYQPLQIPANGFDMDRTEMRFRGDPIDMDMEPLFRHFRVTLRVIEKNLIFQKPLNVCITLNSYKRIEQPGKLVETPHEQT